MGEIEKYATIAIVAIAAIHLLAAVALATRFMPKLFVNPRVPLSLEVCFCTAVGIGLLLALKYRMAAYVMFAKHSAFAFLALGPVVYYPGDVPTQVAIAAMDLVAAAALYTLATK